MAVYQFTSASKFSDNETVTIAQVSPETTGTLFQMVLNGPPARTIDLENPSEEVATLESGDKLIINSVDGLDDTYVFAISKMPVKVAAETKPTNSPSEHMMRSSGISADVLKTL